MAQGQAQPAAPAAPKQAPLSQDERGIPDPVLRIQALLDREKAPQEQAAPALSPVQAAAEQIEQPEATPEAEAPAGPNRQVEGDQAPSEDAPAGDEIPLDQLEAIELEVTTKGEDGKDVVGKHSVKELRLGYMRQQDYQRKTAEVARQRDEVGQKVRQAIEGERSSYQQQLQQMQAVLLETAAPELKDVNWNDLATNNAFEYVRLRNRADQLAQVLSNFQGKQKEIEAKQKAEVDTARSKLAVKAIETLEAEIPGWNDALYQTLMKSGSKHGYKPEEVATWVDARAIKVLHKAYLYDQLQAEKTQPAVEKKVVVPPKVVRPGPAQNPNQRQQQEQGAMKRLQTSGRIEDAAAVIRSRLG